MSEKKLSQSKLKVLDYLNKKISQKNYELIDFTPEGIKTGVGDKVAQLGVGKERWHGYARRCPALCGEIQHRPWTAVGEQQPDAFRRQKRGGALDRLLQVQVAQHNTAVGEGDAGGALAGKPGNAVEDVFQA